MPSGLRGSMWRYWPVPPKTPRFPPTKEGKPMNAVEIYTTPICGFCHAAKRLLTQKGISYTEIDVMRAPDRKAEMVQRANGGRTVPQIFVGGTHVGGCDELYALDRAGKLDSLLSA